MNSVKIIKKRYSRCNKKQKSNKDQYRLNKAMARAINKSLHGTKNGQHWEDLVGYTIKQLKRRLKRLFEPEMNWSNYGSGNGKWTIDHIIPKSMFNFISPKDPDFRKCWGLKNLQPMWFRDNISKSNRLNSHFQGSFSFNGPTLLKSPKKLIRPKCYCNECEKLISPKNKSSFCRKCFNKKRLEKSQKFCKKCKKVLSYGNKTSFCSICYKEYKQTNRKVRFIEDNHCVDCNAPIGPFSTRCPKCARRNPEERLRKSILQKEIWTQEKKTEMSIIVTRALLNR